MYYCRISTPFIHITPRRVATFDTINFQFFQNHSEWFKLWDIRKRISMTDLGIIGNPLQNSCLENPMEEPGRLQSMGSRRVGYDWASSLSPFTFMHWRRKWHPTPVLLPGKSHGRRSLEGCSPWGRWGSDTTEQLHFHFSLSCIGEGNGNPLQCSCLENPRDGGACWAAVYGAAQSRIRLKWLSSSSSSSERMKSSSMGL